MNLCICKKPVELEIRYFLDERLVKQKFFCGLLCYIQHISLSELKLIPKYKIHIQKINEPKTHTLEGITFASYLLVHITLHQLYLDDIYRLEKQLHKKEEELQKLKRENND